MMERSLTLGQRLAGSFALVVALSVVVGGIGIYALRRVVAAKDRVISTVVQNLVDAEKLNASMEGKAAAGRGFLLTGEERLIEELRVERGAFDETMVRLRGDVGGDNQALAVLQQIETAEHAHRDAMDTVIEMRRASTPADQVAAAWDRNVSPKRDSLDAAIKSFVRGQEGMVAAGVAESTRTATSASILQGVSCGAIVILGVVLSFALSRTLGRQITTAVGHVQSSSTELQAAASQQATGSREQASAMSEISTTISELLATSRQIAESAQRVAGVSSDTASAARAGEATVERGHEAMATIRRQVDLVVGHMLDLGKKSQEIGSVLDIVSELAEQTNILAINATIEAAGAGEAGRRFAAVAEEIRKLADRVGASTKDVRTLIDEVRGAVNTSVMATEGGAKAVETGGRQFAEITEGFRRIAGLVATTTEAAREIELSTKQQSTAVEQVKVAISNVAQATKETEASASQTLQTASQLAGLSRELLLMVATKAA